MYCNWLSHQGQLQLSYRPHAQLESIRWLHCGRNDRQSLTVVSFCGSLCSASPPTRAKLVPTMRADGNLCLSDGTNEDATPEVERGT